MDREISIRTRNKRAFAEADDLPKGYAAENFFDVESTREYRNIAARMRNTGLDAIAAEVMSRKGQGSVLDIEDEDLEDENLKFGPLLADEATELLATYPLSRDFYDVFSTPKSFDETALDFKDDLRLSRNPLHLSRYICVFKDVKKPENNAVTFYKRKGRTSVFMRRILSRHSIEVARFRMVRIMQYARTSFFGDIEAIVQPYLDYEN